MIKAICLISSGQPSANPRMLKEAITLLNLGYKVSVIWSPISPWADKFDNLLFEEYKSIKWIQAGYHHQRQYLFYWFARLRQKLWQIVFRLFGDKFDAAIKAIVLFYQELETEGKRIKADIYIGHNLGALPAVYKAAAKHNGKTIFDFEDFYRGELNQNSFQYTSVCNVESKYLKYINYCTAASPDISNRYNQVFPHLTILNIYNVFPLKYANDYIIDLPASPLKLFWFSQYIGRNRGLETVIQAIGKLKNCPIKLTLLGSVTEEIKNYFYDLCDLNNLGKEMLTFHDPVSEREIVQIAALHHIGIASEIPHNQNRDLCLTNKIFMYLLAGNAIVFSNTIAQKYFLDSNPNIGHLYEQFDSNALASILISYSKNDSLLTFHRQNAFELSKSFYNWDLEKSKYQKIIDTLLSKI